MIENKKAKFNYKIDNTISAGIKLLGWEIKSLNDGKCDMSASYCIITDKGLDVTNLKLIPNLEISQFDDTNENRLKRLLLKKKELKKIKEFLLLPTHTIVPLKIYRNEKGWYKVLLGLAKGKTQYDKRVTIKDRDIKRYNS